jgi:hypothetical protein
MDNYGSEDMIVPQLKLIQNVGGDFAKGAGAKPGDFYFDLTGEILPGEVGFEVIIADMVKTRTYWGRAEIDDEPPACASRDGEVSLDGKNCRECKLRMDNPAAVDPKARRERCSTGYNLLTFLVKDSSPAVMRLTGISAGAARALLTSLKLNKQLKGAIEKAVIKVTSEKKKTANGEAYAVHFTLGRLLTDQNDIAAALALTAELLGKELALPDATEEERPALTAGNVPAPPPLGQPATLPAKPVANIDTEF